MSYDDIINTEYPFKLKHPRMSIHNRSSQFAPFAALNGHSESIKETARITDSKIELSENDKERINNQLCDINEHIKEKPLVEVTYFIKDSKKEGGKYKNFKAKIRTIDLVNQILILVNKEKIPINDIIKIKLPR